MSVSKTTHKMMLFNYLTFSCHSSSASQLWLQVLDAARPPGQQEILPGNVLQGEAIVLANTELTGTKCLENMETIIWFCSTQEKFLFHALFNSKLGICLSKLLEGVKFP